jgi:hypothetical protein
LSKELEKEVEDIVKPDTVEVDKNFKNETLNPHFKKGNLMTFRWTTGSSKHSVSFIEYELLGGNERDLSTF